MSSFEPAREEGPELSPEDKAAFVKAMFRGLEPGSEAALAVQRKKAGEPDTDRATVPEDEPKLEILRRIPATPRPGEFPAAASVDDEASAQAIALARSIESALGENRLDALSPAARQALFGALCRLWAASDEAGTAEDILGPGTPVTATDAMVVCGGLLRAVDLQVFELALWQSWSSR